MINRMIIQGRLTRNPDMSITQSGLTRCNFTVAWSEKRGENETQLFLNCTAWRATAEFIEKYFSKGQEIVIEGSLVQRKYAGKDGVERTVIEMPSVDRVHFCGPKRDENDRMRDALYGSAPDDPALVDENGFSDVTDDDELPF